MFENTPYPFGTVSTPTATQPYGYPMGPYSAARQPVHIPQLSTNIVYVNGIDDVRNRQMPYNSDTIFVDNDKPLIYRKIVNDRGQFEVKIFSVTEYTEPAATPAVSPVSREEFENLQREVVSLRDTLIPKSIGDNNGTGSIG